MVRTVQRGTTLGRTAFAVGITTFAVLVRLVRRFLTILIGEQTIYIIYRVYVYLYI